MTLPISDLVVALYAALLSFFACVNVLFLLARATLAASRARTSRWPRVLAHVGMAAVYAAAWLLARYGLTFSADLLHGSSRTVTELRVDTALPEALTFSVWLFLLLVHTAGPLMVLFHLTMAALPRRKAPATDSGVMLHRPVTCKHVHEHTSRPSDPR